MPRIVEKVLVTCEICSTTWHVKPSRARQNNAITCSRECLAELRRRNTRAARDTGAPRLAGCAHCGKLIERRASQLAKYPTNYCDRTCKAAAATGQPNLKIRNGEWLPCETCGTQVWRTPATKQPRTFCTRACGHIANRGPKGERVVRIVKPCANGCGRTLRLQPSHARKYKFCSWRCAARRIQGAKRGMPGRSWPVEQRLKLSLTLRRRYAHDWAERRAAFSRRMSGRGNPQWRDGRARSPYEPGFTKSLKQRIADRDGHRCRKCGAPRRNGTHVVHHMDGTKHNHSEENLVLLCKPCHGRLHARMAKLG